MFSTVTIVNNTVLHTWKMFRVDLKQSHYKQKTTIWGDECVNSLDLDNLKQFQYKQKDLTMWGDECVNYHELIIIPQCISNHHIVTLNTHSHICLLFLNKAGKNEK